MKNLNILHRPDTFPPIGTLVQKYYKLHEHQLITNAYL